MVLIDTKMYQKMKNGNWLNIEQNIKKWGKKLYCNYKKLF